MFGGLVGAAVGFAIAATIYLRVNPMLEGASGPVRELQGLLWNIVPVLTAAGFGFGLWLVARRPQRPSRSQRREADRQLSGKA